VSTAGTRGKYAEEKVKAFLSKLEATGPSWHMRLPDARAGSFTATTGDFIWVYNSNPFMIEVKEVDHNFRLPHANFKPDQVARLRAAAYGGVLPVVLIYFTPLKLWRLVPITVFVDRSVGGSWDLSKIEPTSLQECLETYLS